MMIRPKYKDGEYRKFGIFRIINWPRETVETILKHVKGYRADVKAIGVFGYYIGFINGTYDKDWKKKIVITTYSRDLEIDFDSSDTEKMLEGIKERLMEACAHLGRRIIQDGDIDWSILEGDGNYHLFNVKISLRKQKWDLQLLLESDVEYIEKESE